jgi:acyl dehydratase
VATFEPGADLPELKITPDRYVTVRYAGASGDFNPIHIDEEFAQQVGLPARILHGLWTMAQVARAQTQAAGGPHTLRRLSVQFRGMGRLEEEIVVTSKVADVADGVARVETEARQGDAALVRRGEAELQLD